MPEPRLLGGSPPRKTPASEAGSHSSRIQGAHCHASRHAWLSCSGCTGPGDWVVTGWLGAPAGRALAYSGGTRRRAPYTGTGAVSEFHARLGGYLWETFTLVKEKWMVTRAKHY